MLPDYAKMPWPPKEWRPLQNDISVADAWYSGDPSRLRAQTAPRQAEQSRFRFWGRKSTVAQNHTDAGLHVPVAADVAATGADLLFGEPPTWAITEAHADSPDAAAVACEDRLNDLAYLDGWSSLLLEAAEIAGALGGVYLRPVVDAGIADHPLLTIVHPDCAVPEFRHGRLSAVTFWHQWDADESGKVWRHLERHSPGLIEHGLYLGNATELGIRHSLLEQQRTAPMARDDQGDVTDGTVDLTRWHINGPLARYVPNALPNPKRRQLPVGRPDTGGTEPLMDSLDETWSSWVRDIRLAKARLIVPDDFLDHHGRGVGDTFDVDRELFSPLSIDRPTGAESGASGYGITLVQFAIRVAEHEATAKALFTQIVQRSGYSPQSFGLPSEGAQQTATEVDARENRSTATTQRKRGYWQRPLEDTAENMLKLDAYVFGSGVTPMRPRIVWPETKRDPLKEAQTLSALALAKAVSTETMVRALHPDWDADSVLAETARIQSEQGVQVDDPMGGVA